MFSLRKFTLHEKIDKNIIREYSAFKLGDVRAVDAYAVVLARRLRLVLDSSKKYVMYASNKSPVTPYCKKNALLVAEKVSKSVGVTLVVAEYTFVYDAETFYDNNLERKKINMPVIKKEDESKIYGHSIIFFEDSIVSGLTLKTTCDILKKLTNEVVFFSGIDLSASHYIEKDFNNYFFNTHGVPGLVRVIRQDGYTFTTQMMRTIEMLSPIQIEELLVKISDDKKSHLLKAFEIYLGRPYNLSKV